MRKNLCFRHLVWLFICSLQWLAVNAFAADKVLDASRLDAEPVSLTPFLAVLEDPSQKLTLADVRTARVAASFKTDAAPAEALSFGITQSAYWLRLSLRNDSDQAVERLLEIAYARLSSIEFHQPTAAGAYQSISTGMALPFATRPYKNRYFVFPIKLPAHAEQVVYLRIHSASAILVPGKLWTPRAFNAYERNDYLVQAWYFGMASAMVLFNVLLFLALLDRIYPLYVGFVALTAIALASQNGLAKEFLWPDSTLWSETSTMTIFSLVFAITLLFMRRMLNTSMLIAKFDHFLIALAFFYLLMPLGLITSYSNFYLPATLLLISTVPLFLGTGIYCLYKRQRSAVFFLVAFAMLLLGGFMHTMRVLGIFPSNALTINGYQMGSALEMVLLAFALADRFNMIRREKAKTKHELLQAQANALEAQNLLVDNLKSSERVLEERVRQRTTALTDSNVALIASNQANEASRLLATTALDNLRVTQAKLAHANEDFRRLLDNSGEGFLTFGPSLLIDTQYSLACESMLGQSPAGHLAPTLFFPTDPVKAELFANIIGSVLGESDPDTRACMMSLLPTEIELGEVFLKAEYKALDSSQFMVVLTDTTTERQMQSLLNQEQRRLELIVMAVSDSRNFFETIQAMREFLDSGMLRIVQSGQTPQFLATTLYREIHTYKGLLSQFRFPTAPKALHDIESGLSGLISLGPALTTAQLAALVSRDALLPPFEADLAILSDALGEDFLLHGDSIVLSDAQARQLEMLAARLLRGESVDTSVEEIRRLLHEISALRKVPLKDVLTGFDGLVRQAAQRLEKEVAPIEVIGGADIRIDPNAYRAFLHALVHVFRNAVAHGLETPEARWAAGKDEVGKISCSVALEGDRILLCIADDGAGLNLQALRQRALASGLYAADELENVADEAIAQLIFRDNISTQQEVSDLAGRGVGLASVLNETKNAGGEVVVKTSAGQGTQFRFSLPRQPEI